MASTYLSRTPASAGNRKIWTLSTWVKRSVTGSGGVYYSQGTTSGALAYIGFNSTDLMEIAFDTEASGNFRSNMVFRDLSAWYHIVITCDTTQATASNRVKAYVNGSQITFGTELQPSQNYDTQMNTTTLLELGKQSNGAGYFFNGLLAHYHFIDGTAYDASAFGETDATTGIWKPKTNPSVTYGTNGFFLKFENSGSLGTDSSGNANNFTVGGGTPTQTIDTPSNVFATLNPLSHAGSGTFSNGNNTLFASGTVNFRNAISTLGAGKGKYYWELKLVSTSAGAFYCLPGITATQNQIQGTVDSGNTLTTIATTQGHSYIFSNNSSDLNYNGGSTSYTKSNFATGDIVQIALDIDNSKLYLGINGTWQNSGDPSSGTGGASIISPDATVGSYTGSGYWSPCVCLYYDAVISCNFGNGYFGTTAVASAQSPSDGVGIFEYAVPTGYKALCTKSINAQEYS